MGDEGGKILLLSQGTEARISGQPVTL